MRLRVASAIPSRGYTASPAHARGSHGGVSYAEASGLALLEGPAGDFFRAHPFQLARAGAVFSYDPAQPERAGATASKEEASGRRLPPLGPLAACSADRVSLRFAQPSSDEAPVAGRTALSARLHGLFLAPVSEAVNGVVRLPSTGLTGAALFEAPTAALCAAPRPRPVLLTPDRAIAREVAQLPMGVRRAEDLARSSLARRAPWRCAAPVSAVLSLGLLSGSTLRPAHCSTLRPGHSAQLTRG